MNTAEALSTANQPEVSLLQEKLRKSEEKIIDLEEQLAWLKRQIFGKRSERIINDLNSQQLMLEGFDNPGNVAKKEDKDKSDKKRRKPTPDGKDKISKPSKSHGAASLKSSLIAQTLN